jgi:hypothetical protein
MAGHWNGECRVGQRARAPCGCPYEYRLPIRSQRSQRGRGGRSGRAGVRVRGGLRRSSRLGRFGRHRSSGLGRGVVGAAELGLGRYGSGGNAGVGSDAGSCGCAVGGRRSWCRIRFPIHVPRNGAGRRGGRSGGRRWRRSCCQIRAAPQGVDALTRCWIRGGTRANPSLGGREISRARRIPDQRTRAPRIPAGDRIRADQRKCAGRRMTGRDASPGFVGVATCANQLPKQNHST